MTLRAAAALGVSFAAASLLTGCYYQPTPAYAYYPPGCIPDTAATANSANPPPSSDTPPDASSNTAPPPQAGPPCRLVPTYAYPSYPYYYPYYGYYGYPGYYAYPGYVYPPVSVGIGARFRL